jgi:sRNA-binding regulator protein Hfq
MSRGASKPRGASNTFDAGKYWRNTLLIAIPLLIPPPPFMLLGIGWLVYRARKYMELRRKEASKVTSRLNTRYVNIMLRNGKQLINVEALDEDDKYIKVMDNEGRELLIDKSYIAMLEPVQTELD